MNNKMKQEEHEHIHPKEDESKRTAGQSSEHMEHMGHNAHTEHVSHEEHGGHEGHGAHVDHSGHEQMFRQKFWVSLLLSIPVLLFSPSIQSWLRLRFAGLSRKQLDNAGLRRDRVYLRGHPILADGHSRSEEPTAWHDVINLAGDQCSFRIQPGSLIPAYQHDLLLGARQPDRYHAAGALDRDAQRAPGFRRPERACQIDAG